MPIQPKQQPPYYNQVEKIKIYRALLHQTGTGAPTATILFNNYNTIPAWTFSSTGYFIVTATGELDPSKTIITATPSKPSAILGAQEEDTGNSFALFQNDYAGSSLNGMINQPIEIITYP